MERAGAGANDLAGDLPALGHVAVLSPGLLRLPELRGEERAAGAHGAGLEGHAGGWAVDPRIHRAKRPGSCHGLANGHPLMARVTGLGCTATALVGAALAVEKDRLAATAAGLSFLAIAGEIAAEKSPGPGSLQLHLLDALYQLDAATIQHRLKIVA